MGRSTLPVSVMRVALTAAVMTVTVSGNPVLAANPSGGPAVIVVKAATVAKEPADHHEAEEVETPPVELEAPAAAEQTDPKSKPGVKAASTWSETEIADAKARCAVILKRINAIAIPETPIKSGVCGAPAPIQLISIGKKPEVTLSPPAIITCELAEGLATWLDTSLQPLAKKHLGAEIIKIENMSSYSCRNAYGRAGNKLSEHGRANALDIRGFTTASGKDAIVLSHWGTTEREIRAKIAAEKALQEKALAAQRALEAKKVADQKASATAPPAQTGALPAKSIAEGIPSTTGSTTSIGAIIKPLRGADPQLSIAEPDKLGGPIPAAAQVAVTLTVPGKGGTPGSAAKRAFLRAAHESACTIFGTTLGPEANNAHRNHFHVDMAMRKSVKICE